MPASSGHSGSPERRVDLNCLERRSCFASAPVSLTHVLCQTPLDSGAETGRDTGGNGAAVRDDRGDEIDAASAIEWQLAARHFIEHHAQSPNVAPNGRGFSAQHLGGHIGERPTSYRAGKSSVSHVLSRFGRQIPAGARPRRSPTPLMAARGDYDVLTLEVAMNGAVVMRVSQRVGDLDAVAQHALSVEIL